jgi:hypothetical protein
MVVASDLCSTCGSADVVRIIYGLPGCEIRAENSGKRVVFASCLCYGDQRDPTWRCDKCGERYGAVLPHSRSSIPIESRTSLPMTHEDIRELWVRELPWLGARWA